MKEILRFKPLFMDILGKEKYKINEQHALILAMMFKLRGYTNLDILTNLLSIAQPGLIRKNMELLPKVLVLLLSIEDLRMLNQRKLEKQKNAARFIQRISEIHNKRNAAETFIKAIHVLFPNDSDLGLIIALSFLYKTISRDQLYSLIELHIENKIKVKKAYDTILLSHPEFFHLIYKKHKEKMLIQPKLPLESFVKVRLTYCETLSRYYNDLLIELNAFLTGELVSISPYQLLHYDSEIKSRIDRCLRHYSNIKIIDNSIYQDENRKGLLGLLTESNCFTHDHKIKIFSAKKISIPRSLDQGQYMHQPLKKDIGRDFKTRDFIMFDNHGCLVYPSQANSTPYYNIAPRFLKTISRIFDSNWR
jgi:hypothetical protein